ncbi:MAG TPA: hypothetical protein PK530_12750 [Anaerolineales bacterium]|nr:hypothetical protein [Anaerolineales bacterium]
MSNNFPPFLYAIFVPVLAFFCLLPLLFAGLVGLGLWRFSRHADGKTTRPQKLTITGFRPPTRLADRRARVQANQIYKEKLAPANPAPRLAPKPALRRTNAGISHKKLAYPQRDADRYKYIEGQFSEFIHH